MIRARLSNGSFVIGVDAENLQRLRAGAPILVDLRALGGTDSLCILFGETLGDVIEQLEHATGQKLPVPTPFADEVKERMQ